MQDLDCSKFTDQKNSCFFSIQNYTGHSTLFQFIFPVIFIFKNVRNFTEVWMYKEDRKTMYLILDEIKTLRPLLSEGYIVITRRKFTFHHSVPRSSRYSTDAKLLSCCIVAIIIIIFFVHYYYIIIIIVIIIIIIVN